MGSWLRKSSSLAAAGVLVALATVSAQPAAVASTTSTTAAPPTSAAEILVDVDTGRVLVQHNDHAPLPPASLTKTLTAMIASDWLPTGADVPVTAEAFNAYPDKVGMRPGQQWPLETALHALITDSANDAAYALAIYIGGSLAGFASVMQDAAGQIGMSDHPVLADPAGLDGTEGVNGGNRISAWDLAIMGRDMMANPNLAAIAAQRTYDFEGPDRIAYHIVSRNLHFLLSYPGAIGVKTGYTVASGFSDIEEAEKGGRHMLAVVLHSNNPDAASADLLTQGFSTPAGAEGLDPTLPAVREPAPVVPHSPVHHSSNVDPPAVKEAAMQTAGGHGLGQTGWIDVLGAAGVVAGIGVWSRKWVRSRSATRR